MRISKRIVLAVVVAGLLLVAILFLGRSREQNPVSRPSANVTSAPQTAPSGNPLTDVVSGVTHGSIDFENNSAAVTTFEIVIRFLFAVLLSGILAFRPRKDVPLFRRSLFVSQT